MAHPAASERVLPVSRRNPSALLDSTRIGAAMTKAGGKVLGSVRHSLNTSDFSSYILQAQSSGAKVVAFANAGADATNSIKQAAEFGVGQSQRLAAMLMFLGDVRRADATLPAHFVELAAGARLRRADDIWCQPGRRRHEQPRHHVPRRPGPDPG